MKINILSISLILMLLAGCSKEKLSTSSDSSEMGVLALSTRTSESGEDNFDNGSTFRMAVYDAGTADVYLADDFGDFYSDIIATKTNDVWEYSFDGGDSSSAQFGYILGDGTNSIDLVAAYPYISNEDLSQVSFTSATQLQYMWAKTAGVAVNSSALTADLEFYHIMSAINFRIKLKNKVTGVTLNTISFELLDSEGDAEGNVVISTGTINFNDGTITPTAYASSLAISASSSFSLVTPTDGGDSYYYTEKPIYLPPFVMNSDDQLKISFKFDSVEILDSITLSGSDFATDEGGYAIERGYRYNIDLELDNYLKFSGTITKDDEWSDETINTDI